MNVEEREQLMTLVREEFVARGMDRKLAELDGEFGASLDRGNAFVERWAGLLLLPGFAHKMRVEATTAPCRCGQPKNRWSLVPFWKLRPGYTQTEPKFPPGSRAFICSLCGIEWLVIDGWTPPPKPRVENVPLKPVSEPYRLPGSGFGGGFPRAKRR